MHTDPIHHDVDRRWLMAYAAGLGDDRPVYTDPTGPGGIVGHPLFPVCVEWPTVLAVRHLGPLDGALSADGGSLPFLPSIPTIVHAIHEG